MTVEVAESVAVITGASSGIARATAHEFARRGADVVLAARDPATLEEAAQECRDAGGRALAVPTDVTDQAMVDELARRAKEEFGRIDVWVNAAAVMAYGEFEKTPADVYRQVIETNLFGQINCARAVLPYFREQDRGVLINVSSVWGSISSPYVSSYVVSKFGVRAFSESLQEALRLEKETKNIHVCTILPQCVDTPIFSHAGNYTGHKAKTVPPVVGPRLVVRAIVRSVERPRRQRSVRHAARFLEFAHAVLPVVYGRLVSPVMHNAAFTDEPTASGPGNVFASTPELNGVDGGWRRTDLRLAAAAGGGLVGASGVAAAWRMLRRRRLIPRWRVTLSR